MFYTHFHSSYHRSDHPNWYDPIPIHLTPCACAHTLSHSAQSFDCEITNMRVFYVWVSVFACAKKLFAKAQHRLNKETENRAPKKIPLLRCCWICWFRIRHHHTYTHTAHRFWWCSILSVWLGSVTHKLVYFIFFFGENMIVLKKRVKGCVAAIWRDEVDCLRFAQTDFAHIFDQQIWARFCASDIICFAWFTSGLIRRFICLIFCVSFVNMIYPNICFLISGVQL